MDKLNQKKRKGIILAGGTGTRLFPITLGLCKQLLPVYDKPMIYYPISTFMLSGIKDILIITTLLDRDSFERLLGDGRKWGINIEYAVQNEPKGLAEAFIIAEEFIDSNPVALILGDNFFYGTDLVPMLKQANDNIDENTVFGYRVKNPQDYGVIEFDENKKIIGIEEKPSYPKSNFALTGIYFYDNSIVEKAKRVDFSDRGELEITDINNMYLKENNLNLELIGRGSVWLDTGSFDSLHQASSFIRTIENRQGFKISSPEEIAWRKNWITNEDLKKLAINLKKSGYGDYLLSLLE